MVAQALGWIDESTRALIPPVHPSTTFMRDPDNQYRAGYSYGRSTNPTFAQPEALLARLEGGASCLAFASGMAAATAVFLALGPGVHVIAPQIMYWGLRNWLKSFAAERGVAVDFADASSTDALAAAVAFQQRAEYPMRIGVSIGDVTWRQGDCFGQPVVEAARLGP